MHRIINVSNSQCHCWPCTYRISPALILTSDPSISVYYRAFDRHRAASLSVLSIILALAFAVVPLSLQCWPRRRRRRRLSSLSGSISSSSHRSLGTQSAADTLSKNDAEKKKQSYNGIDCRVNERTPMLGIKDDYGGTSARRSTTKNDTTAEQANRVLQFQ
jgi:hypothetical protein